MEYDISLFSKEEIPFIVVKNNKVIEVSRSFEDMTEYPTDMLINKNLIEVFKVLKANHNLNFENGNNDISFYIFTKNLKVKSVDLEITNDLDKSIYLFKEKPDSSLEEKFPYIEQFSKGNQSGVAIFSAPGLVLLKANEKYISYLNHPFNEKESSIGKPIREIVTGYEGSIVEETWTKVINSGEPFFAEEIMFEIDGKGEAYFDISIVPIYENDKIKYFIENVSDVTERVLNAKIRENQEKELKKQADRFKQISDNMNDALFIINKDGSYEYINKKAIEMSSQFENLKLHNDLSFFDENKRKISNEERPSSRILRGESIKNLILTVENSNKTIYLSFNGEPIYNSEGDITNALLCISNISDRYEYEIQLAKQVMQDKMIKFYEENTLKAEKENEVLEKAMEMKDEFLAIISHEFRTPLNVINMATQTMNCICGDELSDKGKEFLRVIRQNTYRQLRLVNNLLDITRANAGNIKIHKNSVDVVSLTKSIAENVSTYAYQKGINLIFTTKLKKKVIEIDDEKYERILLNLLSNAIKFSYEGNLIMVTLSSFKGQLEIKVKDNGIGIPEDKLDLIFERFGQVDCSLTRPAEGAGIGLSLVKKLVEAIGGTISVESKIGEGSVFKILIPFEESRDEHKIKENHVKNLIDNHLIQVIDVEFSDIYF
ncbi:MAG: ATP-binding protein [Clostridiaceae bacterium]